MGWILAFALLATTRAATDAPEAPPARLDGIWVSDCLPIGQNGRHGYVATIAIARQRVEAHVQLFARSSCDVRTLRVDYRGDRLRLERRGDRLLLRQRALSVTLTPQDDSVVRIYNRPGSGCGLTGWQVNLAKSVAGRDCGPPTAYPAERAALFDSIWAYADGSISFAAFPLRWLDSEAALPGEPMPARFRRQRR